MAYNHGWSQMERKKLKIFKVAKWKHKNLVNGDNAGGEDTKVGDGDESAEGGGEADWMIFRWVVCF